ncbi:LLM class flavin-dependent oxidoreductase [Pigmentiphaga aceris]|uniref:LLM class flavin-dependent oxidoreductase n=1 Tax=Pigmentiphaga aceris TaxID=1940612 RepID=A0A5C0AZ54_9BURK|nr:LLM class flavin-dependent oxidoreductase [Pigmentiphaga aceris]QEI06693.1 LLM class flavin-dependent oxidoreductase [Pigmentiphaga aceris]
MSIEFNWFLPTNGDGRHLVSNTSVQGVRNRGTSSSLISHREPDIDYLVQVAQAADAAGFHAALIPTGPACEDAWLTAAAAARDTRQLKFLVAFRPGFELPAYAAQKVATLQTFTQNRLLLNVVTGGEQDQQESYGDFLDHDARYERTAEFLDVVAKIWRGRAQDHEGKHYRVKGGGLVDALATPPTIYFGGASPAAEHVAASHSDVYLLWGETPPMVAERLKRVGELAAAQGRQLRYGLRLHIIARATEAQAWAEADRLLAGIPRESIERARATLGASQAVGQQRMNALHAGRTINHVRDLEVYPNLWAGVGLVRGGAGTALVGSYQQVADRLREYASVGISSFILSGYPNLEEAIRTGEEVTPLLQ